jgi:predicted RNA-binding protein YlxR (DUF448 family)
VSAAAATRLDNEPHDGRDRRCIVSGEVRPEADLIRFVAGPEGEIVPDIAAKLPGRGLWVSAERQALEKAVKKNHFSRAAKAPVKIPADLVSRVQTLIARRMADDLGLARRSGAVVLGFDKIAKAFAGKSPPKLLVEAADGAADGRRKLLGVASVHGFTPKVLDCLDSAELSLALGRENVVHAALKSGPLTDRLVMNAGRLAGLRGSQPVQSSTNTGKAGPTPAPKGTNERDE